MPTQNQPLGQANPHRPLVGVIRWDGQAGFEKGQVGYEEEIALGPRKWHNRLPFYATVPAPPPEAPEAPEAPERCTLRGDSQVIVDQENILARDAGIDYWAFVWYPDSTYLSKARNLHVQSRVPEKVNFCAIVEKRSEADIDVLVEAIKDEHYQRVLGDRPLVYALNSTPEAMAYLRKRCDQHHLPAPFIAVMEWSGPGAAKLCDALGGDAISAYVSACNDQANMDYEAFAQAERTKWDRWQETGKQVIPFVTVGWDPRPRTEMNPRYTFAPPGCYKAGYSYSTGPQLGVQVRACLEWVGSHEASCVANSILCYSWNEFSEGGTLCPKLSGDRQHLDAVKAVVGKRDTVK